MVTTNPFDLLGDDDNDDPNQLLQKLPPPPKKAPASAQSAAATQPAKLPSKPLPPAQADLEEAAKPLDEYASLREFFVRTLKEGSRPIDSDPCCLISPVDGTILRFGELKGAGSMIEQVKGFSYFVSSLLGASPFLPVIAEEDIQQDNLCSYFCDTMHVDKMRKIKILEIIIEYTPVDWNVLVCRHFSGRLFPLNERAARTIRNLYVENERIVLEGRWQEGFMAMAAIGATTIGSIELFIEPELWTNQSRKNLLHSEPPEERVYEPEAVGVMLKKGDEVAAFNIGSTVTHIPSSHIKITRR